MILVLTLTVYEVQIMKCYVASTSIYFITEGYLFLTCRVDLFEDGVRCPALTYRLDVLDDGVRYRMLTARLRRADNSQELVQTPRAVVIVHKHAHVTDTWHSLRHGARLIKHDTLDLVRCLQWFTTLDQHAVDSAHPRAHHHSCGRGQTQRAWTGYAQHCYGEVEGVLEYRFMLVLATVLQGGKTRVSSGYIIAAVSMTQ